MKWAINPPDYILSQWLFCKLLALNYFIAFLSLFVQIKGLYGSKGILPIHELLNSMKGNRKRKLYLTYPTLFWWSASDRTIQLAAAGGIIVSLLVLVGFPPAPLFLLLWLLYLSFFNAGSDFLSFQWDALLLEIGFFAIFFAIQSPPPLLLIVAAWFLLFRFIFSSGAVKFLSQCPEWRSLEAMQYHYETQPLPTRLAYYAHHYLRPYVKFSTMMALFFELVVPFFIFTSAEIRLWTFILLIFFQVLIFLTGNYAFFNLLTCTLCIPLLEDRYLAWFFGPHEIYALASNLVTEIILNAIGAIFLLLNAFALVGMFFPMRSVYHFFPWMTYYHFVNQYGLFAMMTTQRDEIIIEGSDDGVEWKEYEFRWKPGGLKIPPKQVAPHQPRLDWQMWFAALGTYHQNPWFINLIYCLLKGYPDVLALLKANPFPNAPPKMIRAKLYEYRFSTPHHKKMTKEWWMRKYKGLYLPAITLNP
jgi:hypothetical protein